MTRNATKVASYLSTVYVVYISGCLYQEKYEVLLTGAQVIESK